PAEHRPAIPARAYEAGSGARRHHPAPAHRPHPPRPPPSGGRTRPSRRNRHPRAGKPTVRKNTRGKRTLSDQSPGDLQELDRAVSYEESWDWGMERRIVATPRTERLFDLYKIYVL